MSTDTETKAFEIVDSMRGVLGIEQGVLAALVCVYASAVANDADLPHRWIDPETTSANSLLEEAAALVASELAQLPPGISQRLFSSLGDLETSARAEIFEALLDLHESGAGRAGGEFRTLRSVAELAAAVAPIGADRLVFDPACGYGSMLLAAARRGAQVFGNDVSRLAGLVTRMRLELHGYDVAVTIGDYLRGSELDNVTDVILMAPPWGMRESKTQQVRRPPWVTGGSSLDLVWLALAAESVGNDGCVVAHMPSGVLERKRDIGPLLHLARSGAVEAIIDLGRGAAASTGIESALLVIRAERKSDAVLMVDASALGVRGADGTTAFPDDDISEITRCLSDFRELAASDQATFQRRGLAAGVNAGKILEEDSPSLSPTHFVTPSQTRVELPAPEQLLLTELRLEGFKPFREPVSVPLAPITLLFGQNSVGKSSLLQALMLLKQSIGAGRFVAEGAFAQLGSFGALVSDHDLNRSVKVGVTFGTPGEWHEPGLVLNPRFERVLNFEFRSASSVDVEVAEATVGLGPDFHLSFRSSGRTGALVLTAEEAVRLTEHVATSDSRWRIASPTAKRTETGPDSFNERRVGDVRRVLARGLDELELEAAGLVPSRIVSDVRQLGRGTSIKDGDLAATTLDGSLAIIAASGREASRIFGEMQYLGPLRSAPQRVSSRGASVEAGIGTAGENLAQYLFEHRAELEEINRWMRLLEMPYRLDVTSLNTGTAGHAVGDLVALLLTDERSGTVVSPADVGFGISQVLPLVVQLLSNTHTVIAIEQPEIHLHPALQARFAELLIDASSGEGAANQVIVETHSEHLMLRLQRRIREGELSPEEVAVLYVDWDEVHEHATVAHIPLDGRGEFTTPWPKGFFAERYDEIFGPAGSTFEPPEATADELP